MNKSLKYVITLGLVSLFMPMAAIADDIKKPAEQIADNTFFDPTRKEEKVEQYRFGVEYRIEAGYVQHQQRSGLTYPDMYLHGARIGATFTFLLPIHFSIQTGVLYTITYGRQEQHWRSVDLPSLQTEYINHRITEHDITIPVRLYYSIPLWKELNLFFFTGPQLHIGLAERDNMETELSEPTKVWLQSQGVPVEPYDRMTEELHRANIQWGLGGGLEWGSFRLQSGYDFGLNNLVRKTISDKTPQFMSEWGWFVSFSYRL